MIVWSVKSSSTWSKIEEGHLNEFKIATIETVYDCSRDRTIRCVMVRFFIGSKTLTLEAPNWYIAPDWSCEAYQYNVRKHKDLKKRFDMFAQGDYTECHRWVQAHLDQFLLEASLKHVVQGQNEGC